MLKKIIKTIEKTSLKIQMTLICYKGVTKKPKVN
ncbi:hypothetical protein [Enterocloster phage PMBT24]|uniref:Uncharacterized protein n=1 Tax=Enterocloster phage PMBT24 TaxID=3025413 RepID=A0AAT9TS97_9CAUD|nr:hypothetical protein [Enterocloster phage PMBT24]DAL89998.1 MAG TPA: hypothetical protein [Caudoviricetes sp.]